MRNQLRFQPLQARERLVLATAAAVAANAHAPVIGPYLHEAPYMGVLFVLLTGACLALGVTALIQDSRAVISIASEAVIVAACISALLRRRSRVPCH